MNNKEKKAEAVLRDNPLAGENFVIPVTEGLHDGTYRDDNGINLPNYLMIDRERHMKVFVSEERGDAIMMFSERAKAMLLYIQYYTPRSKDFIDLTSAQYMKKTGIKSRVTFTLARAELINNNIIVQSAIPGIYWINPRYFFPGSRTQKYPSNLSVKSRIS